MTLLSRSFDFHVLELSQVRAWYRGEYRQRTMAGQARWAFKHTPSCSADFLAALQACEKPEEVHFLKLVPQNIEVRLNWFVQLRVVCCVFRTHRMRSRSPCGPNCTIWQEEPHTGPAGRAYGSLERCPCEVFVITHIRKT